METGIIRLLHGEVIEQVIFEQPLSRLATIHGWKKLDVSTSPRARNAGVRYAAAAIEEFILKSSY